MNFIGVKDNIVHFYIKFMGCTSRQIGNVYIALCELMDSLIGILENGVRDDLLSEVFFRHYSNLPDRLGFLIQDNLDEPRVNMEYFYDFMGDNKSDLTGWETLLDASINNRQWFREIIGRLFLVYGNAYLIGRQNMEDCLCYQDRKPIWKYAFIRLRCMRNGTASRIHFTEDGAAGSSVSTGTSDYENR